MYILDTHTLLWFLSEQSLNKLRLNGTIRDEDAILITRDEKIPLYPVKTMAV